MIKEKTYKSSYMKAKMKAKSKVNLRKTKKKVIYNGGSKKEEDIYSTIHSTLKELPDDVIRKIYDLTNPKKSAKRIERDITLIKDYKVTLKEKNVKIENLKKIFPELLKKYNKIIKENTLEIDKINSIRITRSTSKDLINKNGEKISKLNSEIIQYKNYINVLTEISEDFNKIKIKDLDKFLNS